MRYAGEYVNTIAHVAVHYINQTSALFLDSVLWNYIYYVQWPKMSGCFFVTEHTFQSIVFNSYLAEVARLYGNEEVLAQFCTKAVLKRKCSFLSFSSVCWFVQDFSLLTFHICLETTGIMNETNKSCWLSSLCDQFKMCKAADLSKSWWLIMTATVWRRTYWATTPHCVSQILMKALWQWVFAHHDITWTKKKLNRIAPESVSFSAFFCRCCC